MMKLNEPSDQRKKHGKGSAKVRLQVSDMHMSRNTSNTILKEYKRMSWEPFHLNLEEYVGTFWQITKYGYGS